MIILISIILFLLIGGINYYLACSLCRLVNHFVPKVSVLVPFIILSVLAVFLLLSFFKPFSGTLQWYVSAIGTAWMGIVAYLLVFTLLADLIYLFVFIFQKISGIEVTTFRAVLGFISFALVILVSSYGFINARLIKTVEYHINLSKSPTEELKVALISDIHLGAIGSESRLDKIISEINAQNPDIVCIAGDLFDTNYNSIVNPEKAIQALQTIKSKYGVYACLGNHDAGKTLPDMEEFIIKANVRLLKDEYVIINDSLILAGRLDSSPIGGTGELKREDFSKVIEGIKEKLPIVVLDHNPANVDTYKTESLILSGHTHKGQIFPGSLVTNAMYSVDYGYYRNEHGTEAIVTSGAGTWGLPMRVGSNCEVVFINLKV